MKVKYLVLCVLFLFSSEILTLLALNMMVIFFLFDCVQERLG